MATSTTTNTTTTAVTTKDMKSKQLYSSMPRIPPKVYLKTVNQHITCNLCKGYLIDATTLVECLHSFCRSCIARHLDNRKEIFCPICEVLINKAKPNIKPDATLQAIVYKLVPGLYEKELLRRRAFYRERTKDALLATPEQRGDDTEHLIFGPNESISLMLEYSDADNSYRGSDDENSNSSHEINSSGHCDDDFSLLLRKPKYLQCPAIFTVSNLKKFLLHKFSINPAKFCVEIMYKVKTMALPDYYTLMDVAYIYTWKRDAPMKFFYCVRAAHSPVTNIDQNAVIFDLQSNRFQSDNPLLSSTESTDQDQSSDADSEVRTERATADTNTNGQTPQEESVDSTSNLSASTSAKPTASSTLVSTSASVSSSSSASAAEITKSVTSTSSVNGTDRLNADALDKPIGNELASSRAPAAHRVDGTHPSERLAGSPVRDPASDRRSNGASPKATASKSKVTSEIKPSATAVLRPIDSKESKERVKTKPASADNSQTKAHEAPTQRNEPKASLVLDAGTPTLLRPGYDAKSTPPIDRNSRLLFNKDDKAKSLSPPLSAENEYDFDQHLLKEQLSEKKKFLKSIHLRPRIPNDSPLVQLPKMPKSDSKAQDPAPLTNSSKDSRLSLANSITSIKSPASSSNQSPSMRLPEAKASKRKSREPIKNVAKVRTVLAASELPKVDASKPASLTSSVSSSTSLANASITSTSSGVKPMAANVPPSNTYVPPKSKLLDSPASMSSILEMSQQNKNHLLAGTSMASARLSQAAALPSTSNALNTKSVFKAPAPSSSMSRDGHKQSAAPPTQSPKSAESETSIIINNVQRPNQADTPRPSSSFKSSPSASPSSSSSAVATSAAPMHPYFFSQSLNRNFLNETEIQEIRNDDAGKIKVYGPTMSLAKPFDAPLPGLPTRPDLLLPAQMLSGYINQNLHYPLPAFAHVNPIIYQQLNNLQHAMTNNMGAPKNLLNRNKKPAITSSGSSKNGSNSPAHGNSHHKPNAAAAAKSAQPLRSIDAKDSPKNVQSLLTSCKIPPSLSITLTNDETESMSRSIFNNKNTNVVNSIEIVKLTDEAGGEPNARFATPVATSSPSNLMQTIEKETTRTSSPAAVHANNHTDTYQGIFLQSLNTSHDSPSDTLLKLKQKPKLGRPPIHASNPVNARPANAATTADKMGEAQKRKPTDPDDKTDAKVRKLHRPLQPHRSPSSTSSSSTASASAVPRRVPDLIAGSRDEKRPAKPSTPTSDTASGSNAPDKPAIIDKALALAVSQAKQPNDMAAPKYQPLQTSSTPIWATLFTDEQNASHKALIDNLTQPKKNSSAFVD